MGSSMQFMGVRLASAVRAKADRSKLLACMQTRREERRQAGCWAGMLLLDQLEEKKK